MAVKKKRKLTGEEDDRVATAKPIFPVVAIGSSAGGLEACTAFLKVLPENLGMAFVFVMHLDPVRESALPEILARSTSMPVVLIEDRMQVRPDHVYVIPKNCRMSIEEGVFHLTEPGQLRARWRRSTCSFVRWPRTWRTGQSV